MLASGELNIGKIPRKGSASIDLLFSKVYQGFLAFGEAFMQPPRER